VLRRKLLETEASVERWKRQAGRHRRRVLSASALRDLLPARLSQVPHRSAARDSAAREQRLLQVSRAYRSALEAADRAANPGARRIDLDGLSWWVPLPSKDPRVNERTIRKEALPYRAISQTRDCSIGGIMLDLGAHDGSTAIPRVALGDVEACYCAEPDPLNYACLVANVVANRLRGLVLPDQIAMGERDGTSSLVRTKSSRGHRLAGPGEVTAATAGSVQVLVRTLDGWVASLGLDRRAISFVKADIQGHELHMFHGAPALVAHGQIAWQIEVCPELLARAGSDPRDLIAFAQRHFTHYINMNVNALGRRRRSVAAFGEVLDHLASERGSHTDVILYRAGAARG
jgi:FkbM family methyltransferase